MNKIIRTVCLFSKSPTTENYNLLDKLGSDVINKGFVIQTKRLCSPNIEEVCLLDARITDGSYLFSVGTLNPDTIIKEFDKLLKANNVSFNIDLTSSSIDDTSSKILFDIIKTAPGKTFNFAYVFNNKPTTPFFPSASYSQEGFSVGLQPTDLSEGCNSLGEWFVSMKNAWNEISQIFLGNESFLGIDSSIAPLFKGNSSFVNFVKRLGYQFNKSVISDLYLKITKFIKEENHKPAGLCGLMLPCLEDFELADEYENGNFSIERNIFLSLHSGVGIDTYPIGINESPDKVKDILILVQGLSNKHNKPLSVRFVSDGKAKIGQKTNFNNQYLKDVVVRSL